MANYAGIDPGVRKSAVAIGTVTELTSIEFVVEPYTLLCNKCRVNVAIEMPRIYPGASVKDPNDIVDLAAVAGEWKALNIWRAQYVYPRDWKGQLAKPVHHGQLWRQASAESRALIADAAGYSQPEIADYIDAACRARATGGKALYSRQVHNLLDAYGLYVYARKKL